MLQLAKAKNKEKAVEFSPPVIKVMIAFGFKSYDINRIFARPYYRNIGSQKVLKIAEFILEAKF